MGPLDALNQAISQMPNQELAGWIMVIAGGIALICSVACLMAIHYYR